MRLAFLFVSIWRESWRWLILKCSRCVYETAIGGVLKADFGGREMEKVFVKYVTAVIRDFEDSHENQGLWRKRRKFLILE